MSSGGYLKANLAGIVEVPALHATNVLYIKGRTFQEYINELVFEDQLEQQEIEEIRAFLARIDITNLTGTWVVDDTNRNAILKSRIDANDISIGTLSGRIDANDASIATLSGRIDANDTSIATLSGRIDANDTSIGTLNDKTRYVTSVQGDNSTNPKVASEFRVSIDDRDKRLLYMTTGANFISSINDSTNQGTSGNYTDNQITLSAQTGMIQSVSHLNRIKGIDAIELTGFGGMGTQSSPNIIIGNGGAQIKIGSEDTPQIGSTNTVIKIGKRDLVRNTETQLRGNILLADARFDDLSTSPALTWSNLISLIPTSGLPLWVASGILTSLLPNYAYSDLWSMAGVSLKNGDCETTTIAKMKGMTIYDPTIDVSIFPKVQTFIATGDISQTVLNGGIRSQTFNGEILLRNNNIVSTNINWVLTESGDKCNYVKISNNDMEMALAGGANNSQMRIGNYVTNGKIRMRVGTDGLQANAHDALAIYNDPASSSSQVLIAGSNVPSGYDTSSKLLVDHQNLTHGIKVTKNTEALITRVNHNNINTPSLTLQSNWTGSTVNTLYLNSSNELMYNGSAVGSGGGTGGGGGGVIYLLRGPTNSTVYTAANLATQVLTASDTYDALPQRSIKLTSYSSGVLYNLFTHRGVINKVNNPIISAGFWDYLINVSYSSNQAGNIYSDVYFVGLQNTTSLAVIKKEYTLSYQVGTGTIGIGGVTYTSYWNFNKFQFTFVFDSVQFPTVDYQGANLVFSCVLEDENATALYTFPNLTVTSASSGAANTRANLVFTAPSTQTLTAPGFLYIGTKMCFKLTLVSGTSVGGNSVYYSQSVAGSPTSLAFTVPTGSFTTPLSLNNSNQKSLLNTNAAMRQYEISLPVDDLELSVFENPNFELRFYFNQLSGSTSNHYIEVFFNDGALSHCHTNLNTVGSTTTSSGNSNALSPYAYYEWINYGTTASFVTLPADTNLRDWDYYVTIEINKAYYGKAIYLCFNGSSTHAYNFDSMYFVQSSSSDSGTLSYGETNGGSYGRIYQAADNALMPIFFSPGAGSFYYASATLVFRMAGISQYVTTLELMNNPMYRSAGATKLNGGGGTSDSLPDGIGCDYHSIRGRVNYVSHRMYLPNNNSSWSPTSIGLVSNNNTFSVYLNTKIQINRIAKNSPAPLS